MTGVPIDANMEYAGNFFTLLTPFTLLGGVTMLLVLTFHGLLFLKLKNGVQAIEDRVKALGTKLGLVMLVVTVAWVVFAAFKTRLLTNGPIAIIAVALAAVLLILSVLLQAKGLDGKAFICSSLAIVMVVVTVFFSMFPNVMISTLADGVSLTIYNASSTPKTLKIMTIVALTAVPIVLAYLVWSYWVFRKRVTEKHLHY